MVLPLLPRPVFGRFTQPDTLVPDPSSGQDFNRYTYVRNNPINYNDPTGHCVESAFWSFSEETGEPVFNYVPMRGPECDRQDQEVGIGNGPAYLEHSEGYDIYAAAELRANGGYRSIYAFRSIDFEITWAELAEAGSDILNSATSLAGACALVAGGVTLMTSGAGAGTFALCGTLTAAGGAAQVAVGTLRGDREQVVIGGFNAAGGVFSRLAGSGTRAVVALTRGDDALLFTDDFVRSENVVSLVTDVGSFIGGTAASQPSTPIGSPLGCPYGECG